MGLGIRMDYTYDTLGNLLVLHRDWILCRPPVSHLQNSIIGAGEMAQSGWHLPCRHEDLCRNSRIYQQELGQEALRSPELERQRQADPGAHWSACLAAC